MQAEIKITNGGCSLWWSAALLFHPSYASISSHLTYSHALRHISPNIKSCDMMISQAFDHTASSPICTAPYWLLPLLPSSLSYSLTPSRPSWPLEWHILLSSSPHYSLLTSHFWLADAFSNALSFNFSLASISDIVLLVLVISFTDSAAASSDRWSSLASDFTIWSFTVFNSLINSYVKCYQCE